MSSMRHASPITGNNVVSRAQPPPGNDEVSTCFNQSQAAPCPIVLNQSFPYNRPALNRMYVVIARPPHMCLHSHFHAGNQENRAALQRRIRRALRGFDCAPVQSRLYCPTSENACLQGYFTPNTKESGWRYSAV